MADEEKKGGTTTEEKEGTVRLTAPLREWMNAIFGTDMKAADAKKLLDFFVQEYTKAKGTPPTQEDVNIGFEALSVGEMPPDWADVWPAVEERVERLAPPELTLALRQTMREIFGPTLTTNDTKKILTLFEEGYAELTGQPPTQKEIEAFFAAVLQQQEVPQPLVSLWDAILGEARAEGVVKPPTPEQIEAQSFDDFLGYLSQAGVLPSPDAVATDIALTAGVPTPDTDIPVAYLSQLAQIFDSLFKEWGPLAGVVSWDAFLRDRLPRTQTGVEGIPNVQEWRAQAEQAESARMKEAERAGRKDRFFALAREVGIPSEVSTDFLVQAFEDINNRAAAMESIGQDVDFDTMAVDVLAEVATAGALPRSPGEQASQLRGSAAQRERERRLRGGVTEAEKDLLPQERAALEAQRRAQEGAQANALQRAETAGPPGGFMPTAEIDAIATKRQAEEAAARAQFAPDFFAFLENEFKSGNQRRAKDLEQAIDFQQTLGQGVVVPGMEQLGPVAVSDKPFGGAVQMTDPATGKPIYVARPAMPVGNAPGIVTGNAAQMLSQTGQKPLSFAEFATPETIGRLRGEFEKRRAKPAPAPTRPRGGIPVTRFIR